MITLIGHGYIGQNIVKELEKQNLDYEWISHTDKISSDTTVIINAAGYTGSPNVDACEIYKQECINGNVVWPLTLEHNNRHTAIVHIGSGCVYTGYKDGGWTEEDAPNFNFNNGSFYSGSKALGQELLKPYLNIKSYLLRIRLPFGDYDNSKNYLSKLKMYQKLIDFENSVSYVNDVAAVTVHFAVNLPKPGIYNVCNPGTITTRQVADMMSLEKEWFTEEEFNDAVKAPRSNCNISSEKLQSVFPIQSSLEALQKAIK
jgi:UDP-glucose 4,6-dehydratase